MERVVVGLDDDLAGSLSRYARRHRLNRDVAAERLLSAALAEWRRDRAVRRFAAGELSFDQAATAADVDGWRFAELLHELTTGSPTDPPPDTGSNLSLHDPSLRRLAPFASDDDR